MTHAAYRQAFYAALSPHFAQGELLSLYHWCVGEIHGWTRAQAYLNNDRALSPDDQRRWDEAVQRLLRAEPVQYVFGKAYFRGLSLYVNPDVLIPRPETEELVQWVLDEHDVAPLRVVDMGTGSGCIALALKAERPAWSVTGIDKSTGAIAVAERNAASLALDVSFQERDIINDSGPWPEADVVVSNPPYIPDDLMDTLEANVRDYEPFLALFAPASDPFVFYRVIAQRASEMGAKAVYFETHATQSTELMAMLATVWEGSVEMRYDLSGKPRFLVLRR